MRSYYSLNQGINLEILYRNFYEIFSFILEQYILLIFFRNYKIIDYIILYIAIL